MATIIPGLFIDARSEGGRYCQTGGRDIAALLRPGNDAKKELDDLSKG